LRAAHRKLLHGRNLPFRSGPRSPPQREKRDPDLSDDEGEARQAQQLREVAARAKVVCRPVDRELFAPDRLLGIPASVGALRDRVRIFDSHAVAPPSIAARSRSSPPEPSPAGAKRRAAPTSSAVKFAPRGTMRCTFVVTSCRPKRKAWMGREFGRSASIWSRVP